MPIIPVGDPDDPRIAAYRAVRERDLVGRDRRFVAEGDLVVRLLLGGSRFAAESLLVGEGRLQRLRPLIEREAAAVPVYVAAQPVIDAVTGFNVHRGVLAIGLRGADLGAGDLLAGLPARALLLALVGIANHDNVGGLFRNAAAFGVGAVLLDERCCDPLYRKAIRVSVGAALMIPFARAGTGTDMLALLASHGFAALALTPSGAETLGRIERPGRAAVLVGTEGPGLPAAVLAQARGIRIPMAPGFDSLNVATAAGIALHALSTADYDAGA